MHNLCNCPNCQTNDCPAAAELEALTKEVERLKQLHTTDMRVTNESADFHMKRCDQLRTQNRELREWLHLFVELGDGEPLMDGLKRQHQQKYNIAYSHGQREALTQTEVKP